MRRALASFFVLVSTLAVQPWALAAPSDISLVSSNSDGVKSNNYSSVDDVSADGTLVVFESEANNLLTADTDSVRDIYVRSLTDGSLTLASTAADGTKSDGRSSTGTLSADGTKLAFASGARNLSPDDADFYEDIYVKDLVTGAVTLASVTQSGEKANTGGSLPMISADGTKVAFASVSSNLDPVDTAFDYDVYVKDLTTGVLTLATKTATGTKSNGYVGEVAISGDGTRVVFYTNATNLDPSDTDASFDVYVKDLTSGALTLISQSEAGSKGDANSYVPHISADGDKVAFYSFATNLVPGDTDGTADVFVKDLSSGTLTLASTSSAGVKGNGSSALPRLSADGTLVLFYSHATNLDPADFDPTSALYIKDLVSGALVLASITEDGLKPNQNTNNPRMSAAGEVVAFDSFATNLDPSDTDQFPDVYAKEMPVLEPDPVSVELKIKKTGANYSVAVLGSPDFAAETLDVATVCFGDAEDPGQRDCSELDGVGVVKDVDRDKDADVTLQFEAVQAGIDLGDIQACLTGETTDGTPVEGCGTIPTKKR